jgi:hypothetical protein
MAEIFHGRKTANVFQKWQKRGRLSRAQKGFTKTRQIHEVIINLSETINFCEKKTI